MFQAEKLLLMNAVIRKNRASSTLARLLRTGFFHPFDANVFSSRIEQVKPWQQEYESARWDTIAQRFKKIVDEIGFLPSASAESAGYIEAESTVEEIEEILEALIEKRNNLQQKLTDSEALLSKRVVYLPISVKAEHTFIHIEYGEIQADKMSVLENLLVNIPHVLIPAETRNRSVLLFVVVLKKDVGTFEKIKKEIGWISAVDVVVSDIPIEEQKLKIERLKDEIKKINADIREISNRYRNILDKIAVSLNIHQKLNQAKKHTYITETTTILSGWIPEQEKQSASEIIRNSDPVAHTEFVPAELSGVSAEEIPVKMNHNRFIKPFELIVGTYGIPRYGTIDPTLFVAISFLLMFGAMFGDIGHGAVFLVTGLLMLWRTKNGLRQAGALVSYVGLSSIVFGFLYGSFFGIEFNPLWINPMEDISVLFRACVSFGVLLLTAGIFLNITNFVINKDIRSVFFDKAGLFSGLVYWAGIGLAAGFIAKRGGAVIKITAIIFSICILAIFFNSLINSVREKEGMLVGLIESFLHIFEIIIGYLANTVSFIRISAFALNHFGFFMTIFAISDILKNAGMSGLSIPFMVLGNIFILLLEGLVVMIQCLRLNYYEFFSRFFIPGKSLYQPLVLKANSEDIKQYLS